MKLTKQQKDTLKDFLKYSRLVIFSSRRNGKTTLLKEIVERNPQAKIGIMVPCSGMFIENYKQYKNCSIIRNGESGKKYDIIIGDEEIACVPKLGGKSISILTPPFVFRTWKTESRNNNAIKIAKGSFSKESFEIEFGKQYN